MDGRPIKEICKGTGQLFRHLRTCNHDLAPAPTLFQAFLHYNHKYDWLRPTLEEIVDTYTKLYSKASCESDIESDGSSAAEEVKEDGEED